MKNPHDRITIPPRDATSPVRIPNSGKPNKKPSGVLNERHSLAQDQLYREWIDRSVRLELVFHDASKLLGTLLAHDTYALHVVTEDGDNVLVFKQSIRWIKPS